MAHRRGVGGSIPLDRLCIKGKSASVAAAWPPPACSHGIHSMRVAETRVVPPKVRETFRHAGHRSSGETTAGMQESSRLIVCRIKSASVAAARPQPTCSTAYLVCGSSRPGSCPNEVIKDLNEHTCKSASVVRPGRRRLARRLSKDPPGYSGVFYALDSA